MLYLSVFRWSPSSPGPTFKTAASRCESRSDPRNVGRLARRRPSAATGAKTERGGWGRSSCVWKLEMYYNMCIWYDVLWIILYYMLLLSLLLLLLFLVILLFFFCFIMTIIITIIIYYLLLLYYYYNYYYYYIIIIFICLVLLLLLLLFIIIYICFH